MNTNILIGWGLIFGAICGAIAYKQKRNVIIGCILGLLFGLITLICYLIIGKKEQ